MPLKQTRIDYVVTFLIDEANLIPLLQLDAMRCYQIDPICLVHPFKETILQFQCEQKFRSSHTLYRLTILRLPIGPQKLPTTPVSCHLRLCD